MNKEQVETTRYSVAAKAPARSERRAEERYLSLLRVGALLVDGRRELCLIRNVSAGGMLIRPYSPVKPGTRLTVELKHGEMVQGVAQWADNDLLGVTFDTPVDVVGLLTASADGPQPRMPRIELRCTALVREDADVHRTRTLNISQGGMCIQTRSELGVGGDVIVSLPGLAPAAGVVKWKDEDCYGIGFNRVIAVNELMSFLQEQQQDAQRRAAG